MSIAFTTSNPIIILRIWINKYTENKAKKITIMILLVAMQIFIRIVDETKTQNKTEVNIDENNYLTPK